MALFIAAACPAGAADLDDDDEQAGTDTLFNSKPAKDWSATVGARSKLSSAKTGGKNLRVGYGPYFEFIWKDAFLSSDRGLGINLISQKGFVQASDKLSAGVSISADREKSLIRSQSQYRFLDAFGNYTPYALGFVDYRAGNLRIFGEATTFLDKNNGNLFTAGSEYIIPLTNKWSLTVAGTVTYGDAAYMRENFGISSVAAAAIGQSPSKLKSGFRDVVLSTEAEYEADRHWSYSIGAGYARLLGDAAESTRVQSRSQPFLTAGVKYRF